MAATGIDPLNKDHRERMKKRFEATKFEGFAPHEVLEFILFFGIPYKDTKEQAKALLNEYGSISAVLGAPMEDLIKIKGIARNSAMLLTMIPELLKYYTLNMNQNKRKLSKVSDVIEYCSHLYYGARNERFYLICLNTQNNIINYSMLQEGTINQAVVFERSIVDLARRHNAHTCIITHNHPSGSPYPSKEDIETTKKVINALKVLGIKLLDHVIIGLDEYFSFAQKGMLNPPDNK